MTVVAVLEIIRLILEIWLETIKGIPVEDRQQMWKDHVKRLEFWEKLFEKFTPEEVRKALKESVAEESNQKRPNDAG